MHMKKQDKPVKVDPPYDINAPFGTELEAIYKNTDGKYFTVFTYDFHDTERWLKKELKRLKFRAHYRRYKPVH